METLRSSFLDRLSEDGHEQYGSLWVFTPIENLWLMVKRSSDPNTFYDKISEGFWDARRFEDRDFTLEQVKQEFDYYWLNFGSLRKGWSHGRLDSKEIRKELLTLRKTERFIDALNLIDSFSEAIDDCSDFHDQFKVPCSRFLSRDQWNRIVEPIRRETKLSDEARIRVRNAIERVSPPLLRSNPRVRFDRRTDSPSDKTLTLTLPIVRGSGFPDDGSWRSFYGELKKANEQFWRGSFAFPGSDRTLRLRLLLHEETDPDRAARVNASVWNSSTIGGSEINYSLNEKNPIVSGTHPMLLAHELGHTLGFPDHYGAYVDETACTFGFGRSRFDIMTSHPDAYQLGAQPDQLYSLYQTYVLGQVDPLVTALQKRALEQLEKRKQR